MPVKVQFAFLGKEHNYMASVTSVGKAGVPSDRVSDPTNTVFYGMPDTFCAFYERLATCRYIYNVRGHDFLSHMGQWKSQSETGTLVSNRKIYEEIAELRKLADLDKDEHGGDANLIVSFGPTAGSFFADAWRPKLKCYRWENLPADLNRKLQALRRYGNIWDVALNASNGWVLQLDKGRRWAYGGELHAELEWVLSETRDDNMNSKKWKRVSIIRLFLNHQHPTEYLLLLSDGRVYARLHRDFEEKLKPLLQKWADDRRRPLRWNFKSLCGCSEESQRKADAGYYNSRGMFHMNRGDHELAYGYLREAHIQDPGDLGIRNRYVKALNKFRASFHDPVLEQWEQNNQSVGQRTPFPVTYSSTATAGARFRNDYVWMKITMESMEGRSDLVEDRSPNDDQQDEWSCQSYVGAIGETGLVEVASTPSNPSNYLPELPEQTAQGRSDTLESHQLSLDRRRAI